MLVNIFFIFNLASGIAVSQIDIHQQQLQNEQRVIKTFNQLAEEEAL